MSPKSPRTTALPIHRIKTIMKTTPDVSQIAAEAVFVMAKATELFITLLAQDAYNSDAKSLDYKNLAEIVQHDEKLEFLKQLIPKKITVRQYKEIIERIREKESEEDRTYYMR